MSTDVQKKISDNDAIHNRFKKSREIQKNVSYNLCSNDYDKY